MDRKQFEMRYNFVPVFDTNRKKRISLAPHLAKDRVYMNKMGFVLIETPETPLPVVGDEVVEVTTLFKPDVEEKPKRGRPKTKK